MLLLFGPILNILIIHCQGKFSLKLWSSFVAADVFRKSFIIVSTHRQRHVTSETGFNQDSPNPNPDLDSFNRMQFLLNPHSDSLCIRIHIL